MQPTLPPSIVIVPPVPPKGNLSQIQIKMPKNAIVGSIQCIDFKVLGDLFISGSLYKKWGQLSLHGGICVTNNPMLPISKFYR